jgi:hypothetical protein
MHGVVDKRAGWVRDATMRPLMVLLWRIFVSTLLGLTPCGASPCKYVPHHTAAVVVSFESGLAATSIAQPQLRCPLHCCLLSVVCIYRACS